MRKLLTILATSTFLLSGLGNALAQQMDGANCDWAYKKLQQHREFGVCREQTTNKNLDGKNDRGRTARDAERAARVEAEASAGAGAGVSAP